MVRKKGEVQTHIRIFRSDKQKLEFLMRRKRIKSQAMAFRLLWKNAVKKK